MVLVAQGGLAAQEGPIRSGGGEVDEGMVPTGEVEPASFWWDASLGAASLRVSCDLCSSDVDSGPLLSLAAGAYASSQLAVGVSLAGWTHRTGDVRERIIRGGITLQYGEDLMQGLHFIAGAGWMHWQADAFRYSAPHLEAGVGWSLPLGSDWSVGNRLTLDVAPWGTLANDDVDVAGGTRMGLARFTVFVRSR